MQEAVSVPCPTEPCSVHQAPLGVITRLEGSTDLRELPATHRCAQTPSAFRSQVTALSRWFAPLCRDAISPSPPTIPSPCPKSIPVAGTNSSRSTCPTTHLHQALYHGSGCEACHLHPQPKLILCSKMTTNHPKLISGSLIHGILVPERTLPHHHQSFLDGGSKVIISVCPIVSIFLSANLHFIRLFENQLTQP